MCHSDNRTIGTQARVLGETDTRDIPVYKEDCTLERQRPEKVSPGAHIQVARSDNQWNSVDYCFGVCKKVDSVNRSGTGSCWNCLCWIVWGYRVSCLAAIVIKDRLHGIDLFTEDRCVCTRRPGLVSNPMTPCDVICVYTKMNENFKGGINNVMLRNNDPVDSCYHQRWSWTHTSVCGKPIREKGRFGCVDTPVRDADWLVECSVGLSPVGDIRIEYIRDPVDRGQSTDAAPLTELPASAATPVVNSAITEQFIPTMPPTPDDMKHKISTESVRQTDRAKVFVVEATEGSTSTVMCQGDQDIVPDLTREGPFDACEVEPEPGQSPLVLNSMPGCQFRMTSYDERDSRDDLDPAYGIHLHAPHIMEYMGAPESARLLARILARTHGPGPGGGSGTPVTPRF